MRPASVGAVNTVLLAGGQSQTPRKSSNMRTWLAEDQDGFASHGKIGCQAGASRHSPSHATRQPDDGTVPIPDTADAVQRTIDAGSVVIPEITDLQCILMGNAGLSSRHAKASIDSLLHANPQGSQSNSQKNI